MKALLLTLGLLAACVRAGYAVEYVTLLKNEEVGVSATSVVEIITSPIQWSPQGSVEYTMNRAPDGDSLIVAPQLVGGLTMTGVVKIKNVAIAAATFKITPANEINVVAPTSLLVIPENSTGNYNIVVETSSDTATWTPFHSQTVSANDAKRFFRTRIVKAE